MKNTNSNFKRKPRNNKSGKWTNKKDVDSKVAESKYNDPSWYVKEGQLAKDVASLSFNNALGGVIRIEPELGNVIGVNTPYLTTMPGIMTLNTVPAIGISGDGSSPINIAAKNIYSFVRHQNSGHSNYDSPDLMMYLAAMDSVYAFVAYLMRVYGTARTFSQVNRYIGDALLTAQGVYPAEVRANLANFRSYINMFITKASAFCTPNVMTLYRRHFWMFSGIYKDEDISKSQMYLYKPIALWKYDELDGAGYLKSIPFVSSFSTSTGINPGVWTLSELYTYGNNMLSALTNSEDINIMSGDILKAYGQNNLWQLGLINEDYVVMPVFSQEVLDQIHNTTFVGNKPTRGINSTTTTDPVLTMDGLNVTQNVDPNQDGRLIFAPEFVDTPAPMYTRLIDLHNNEPTPEEVIVATRNAVMGACYMQHSKYTLEILTCGSDLCLTSTVYQTNTNGELIGTHIAADHNIYSSALAYILGKFKDAPIYYQIGPNEPNGLPGNFVGIFGEINNYTLVSYDDLKRMHESAILAMLGVPFYGVSGSQG